MDEMTKDLPVQDFAISLEAMTDDEIFMTMAGLERRSETAEGDAQEEILARIALTEDLIEQRYPGQSLTPYRAWKQRQPIL
jgi:hypothetical protein